MFHQSTYLLLFSIFLSRIFSLKIYSGRTSFDSYIQTNICNHGSSEWKILLVTQIQIDIENFTTIHTSNASQIANYYHCFDYLFQEIRLPELDQLIITYLDENRFQYKKLLVVFDFTNYRNDEIDQKMFENIFKILDEIYFKCLNCRRFISLFNWETSSTDNDEPRSLIEKSFEKSRNNFQITIINCNRFVIHVRPNINGCLTLSGLFEPKTQIDFNQLEMENGCNLNNTILRVTLNHLKPYCSLRSISTSFGEQNVEFLPQESIESEFLKILEQTYRFRSKILYGNQIWGPINEPKNGLFNNGTVGHVFYGTSHLSMCSLSLTHYRMKVLSFTNELFYQRLIFVTRRPKQKSRNWIIATPFSGRVWIAIILAFLLILLSIYLHFITFGNCNHNHLDFIWRIMISITLKQGTEKNG